MVENSKLIEPTTPTPAKPAESTSAASAPAPARRANWSIQQHIDEKLIEIKDLEPQAVAGAVGAQKRIDTLKAEIEELKNQPTIESEPVAEVKAAE